MFWLILLFSTSNTLIKILHQSGSQQIFHLDFFRTFLGAKQRKKKPHQNKDINNFICISERTEYINKYIMAAEPIPRKGLSIDRIHSAHKSISFIVYTIKWYIKWLVNASLVTSSLSLHFPMGAFWRNRLLIIGTQEYRAYEFARWQHTLFLKFFVCLFL